MYLLLIGVHSIFFYISYLMGNILMQGAFLLLLLFFLLYFSPLFFQKNIHNQSKSIQIPDLEISPKKSILIPLILTYFGIYVLVFTVTRDIGTNFSLHLSILLFIFLIFGGYIFAFDWDTIFFRDALRFHLICSYCTILAQLVYFFILAGDITIIHMVFSIVTMGFSYFFFISFQDESISVFLIYILSLLITIATLIVFGVGDIHILTLLGFLGITTIILFEYTPKLPIFNQFIQPSRVFLLSILLGISILFLISPLFSYFHFVYFLPIYTIFLFSIHIRYSNYISYSIAIFIMFFLYSYLFYSLILLPDILSVLLFIFFFSFCIIGNTYFWEERYPYDFSLLHYSSIGFSVIAGLYSLFFVAWGAGLTLFLACFLFSLAVLFILSYFRFQTQ